LGTRSQDEVTSDSIDAQLALTEARTVNFEHTSKWRTPEETLEVKKWVLSHTASMSETKLDLTNKQPKHRTTCKIDTKIQDPVIKGYVTRMNPEDRAETRKQIDAKLKEGIIEDSSSPWSSSCLLVRRKGKARLCTDYRALNKVTVRNSYAMPRIDDVLDVLDGATHFSNVDCLQAYHQIPITDERSKDLTTFQAPDGGLYRYNCMAFGLVNAPAIWSQFIDTVMRGLKWQICLVYMDDVIIYTGGSLKKHLAALDEVFNRLDEYGLKVRPSKSIFAAGELVFLGHLVGVNGVGPDPSNIKAISEMRIPATVKNLRAAIGMFSFYRKFIPNFADVCAPLHDVVKLNVRTKRDKNNNIILTPEQQAAFDKLKTHLTSEPIYLAHPQWNAPFEVRCDASGKGLGATLVNTTPQGDKVVMYASRSLTDPEKKYLVWELEALAVVWAITLFKHYLYGRKFVVQTDNRAIKWLLTREQGGRLTRWIMRLQEFMFEIKHRPGIKSADVDGPSRNPLPSTRPYNEEIIEPLYDTAPTMHTTESQDEQSFTDTLQNQWITADDRPAWTRQTLAEAQAVDETCQHIKAQEESKTGASLGFEMEDGLLVKITDGRSRILVPKKIRTFVMGMYHGLPITGHMGIRKTLTLIRSRFFWTGMRQDIRNWIQACSACVRAKTPRPLKAGWATSMEQGRPFHTIAMDIVGPTPDHKWILTAIDVFTRWPIAIVIPDRSAKTIAKAINAHIFTQFGIPHRILTDRAKEFIDAGLHALYKSYGITRLLTAGYNSTGNSHVERFHSYLNSAMTILRTVTDVEYEEALPGILFAYRISTCDSTGFSPYKLMFGRDPTLPTDVLFGVKETEFESERDYVKATAGVLAAAYEQAREAQHAAAMVNKARHNENREEVIYVPGTKAFFWMFKSSEVKEKGSRAKWRMWWHGPYTILKKSGDKHYDILIDGKIIKANVNRLKKEKPWSEDRHDTADWISTLSLKTRKPIYNDLIIDDEFSSYLPPEIGETVIFPMQPDKFCRNPFGIGRMLGYEKTEMKIHWLGNATQNPAKPYLPAWRNKQNQVYFKKSPTHRTHTPVTNFTEEHPWYVLIQDENIIIKGFRILDSVGKIKTTTWRKLKQDAKIKLALENRS
jgi:hypothetical protein